MPAKSYSHFHELPHCCVVLICNGIYKEVPIYQKGKHLYGKTGGGFIRLLKGGGTTAKPRWTDLHLVMEYEGQRL